MKHLIVFISFLLISAPAFCQSSSYEYFITLNGNLYVPSSQSEKGIYPILGYDKETDPKLLIGGFGVGIAGFKPIKNKLKLKGQANLSKHTYWDEAILLTDETGNPVGDFAAGTSDYAIGLVATVHYSLTSKLSLGAGLGGQLLLLSLSRTPEINDAKSSVAVNRYYKSFVPTLPVELSYIRQKKMVIIRYEQGLINRLKGDLKEAKRDKFSLLTFELGFKIKA